MILFPFLPVFFRIFRSHLEKIPVCSGPFPEFSPPCASFLGAQPGPSSPASLRRHPAEAGQRAGSSRYPAGSSRFRRSIILWRHVRASDKPPISSIRPSSTASCSPWDRSHGGPFSFYSDGGSKFRRLQGFVSDKTLVRRFRAAPSAMGPLRRGGGVALPLLDHLVETCQGVG